MIVLSNCTKNTSEEDELSIQSVSEKFLLLVLWKDCERTGNGKSHYFAGMFKLMLIITIMKLLQKRIV